MIVTRRCRPLRGLFLDTLNDPGVPLRFTPGFMLSPRFAGSNPDRARRMSLDATGFMANEATKPRSPSRSGFCPVANLDHMLERRIMRTTNSTTRPKEVRNER